MPIIIPVAGGKGGVGKSICSLNIATSLALNGRKTLLIDMDLGAANLHTLMGMRASERGIGHYICRLEKNMEMLVQQTSIENLYFIAGDSLLPGTANMDYAIKMKIIREIRRLSYDCIIVDLGAGSAYNTLDFFLVSPRPVLVMSPENTSILNAYAFLKAAIYRYCYRLFASGSEERSILQKSMLSRFEGKECTFAQAFESISSHNPDSAAKMSDELKKFRPSVLMNMCKRQSDANLALRLQSLVNLKLSCEIDFLGFVPFDSVVPISVTQCHPAVLLYAKSAFASVFPQIVARLSNFTSESLDLQDAPENFDDIVREFFKSRESE